MSEKRKTKRKRPIYYLKLTNLHTNDLAGGVLDISPYGIKLSGTEKYEKDSITRFQLPLPDAIQGEKLVILNARNVWSQFDTGGDFYDYYTSGFCLENVKKEEIEAIENSLKSYLFEG